MLLAIVVLLVVAVALSRRDGVRDRGGCCSSGPWPPDDLTGPR